ncbi:MAG: alpha/beta hydrolase [Actinomycetota bacterium]|nr:alpha/beta hydrolase [Actinomycetota bacterium]
MALLPDAPPPRRVMSADGVPIATYEWGDPDAPVVVAVHGFASSAISNWHVTGWTRELTRAGFRVIAIDQRGHGESGKPHDPAMYTMDALVTDLLTVVDTYLIDEFALLGYSLGARVGWHTALELAERLTRAVLGGIPDGDPLTRFRVDEARGFVAGGSRSDDRLTMTYLDMAAAMPDNDLGALISLVEGMRGGAQPDAADPPQQPVLFATGTQDPILEQSRRLAEATPHGSFLAIPDRNHFNAPTSKAFRVAGVEFLAD